jgi:signal transduction histidine kinase
MLSIQEPLLDQEIYLIIYFVGALLFIGCFVVIFFVVFQKRKNQFLIDKIEAQKKYEKELVKSQMETREQTFKNIAWELHDNIGQLLSVASMQLNMLSVSVSKDNIEQVTETKNLLTDSVQQIRNLSRTLNNDVIKKNGLIASLEYEFKRLNRLNLVEASLIVEGEEKTLNSGDEIFLFRILQEFLNNVLKHANADKLSLKLNYTSEFLEIIAKDDGVGFDISQKTENSGLETMKSRAVLLFADYSLTSSPNKGTNLTIKYPYYHEQRHSNT